MLIFLFIERSIIKEVINWRNACIHWICSLHLKYRNRFHRFHLFEIILSLKRRKTWIVDSKSKAIFIGIDVIAAKIIGLRRFVVALIIWRKIKNKQDVVICLPELIPSDSWSFFNFFSSFFLFFSKLFLKSGLLQKGSKLGRSHH